MEEEQKQNTGLPSQPAYGSERELTSAFEWSAEAMAKLPPGPSERQSRKKKFPVLALAVALLTAVSLALLVLAIEAVRSTPPAQQEPELRVEEKVVYVREFDPDSGLLTTPELYAQCAPSVVTVLADGAVGSGFILTSDGYLATAAHVVKEAKNLTVRLSDGREFSALAVDANALCDLALLKIDATGLPQVQFASSSELLIGERVVAIGTPASADYAGSVSSGELSYLNRTVRVRNADGELQKTMTLLQTDATLNPGNSGCPLFDGYGQVVGVVTMKLGADFSGIGFAIPSDGAAMILSAMMAGSLADPAVCASVAQGAPCLGLLGETATLGDAVGVRILSFESGLWSAAAMLKEGDLILGIHGEPTPDTETLRRTVEQYFPGDVLRITVLRHDQQLTFEVELGERA